MSQITFFPLGNADCCLIALDDGRRFLFDFANQRNSDDKEDKRIDLAAALRDDLEDCNRNEYDVVAFTHLDKDHICGSSNFFHFEHSKDFQGDDRVKIKELWVPAAVI